VRRRSHGSASGPWKGLYSLASAVGLALIVVGYGMARRDPVVLYTPPGGAAPPRPRRHAAGLSASVRRLPAGPDPRGREAPVPARRQALGLAHLLANGMLADVLLFGAFLAGPSPTAFR
jgi:hypothetical protein